MIMATYYYDHGNLIAQCSWHFRVSTMAISWQRHGSIRLKSLHGFFEELIAQPLKNFEKFFAVYLLNLVQYRANLVYVMNVNIRFFNS